MLWIEVGVTELTEQQGLWWWLQGDWVVGAW